MRLVDVKTLELEEFFHGKPPGYAILSHAWETEEVSYQEIQILDAGTKDVKPKTGYENIRKACSWAEEDGIRYMWIDTCCINKISSAELSEAINSMLCCHQQSMKCYAYLEVYTHKGLERVFGELRWEHNFVKSRWFTKGWTLQELLAPKTVEFRDKNDKYIGSRIHPAEYISQATRIDQDILVSPNLVRVQSVAKRMSLKYAR
ncbi:HET-domain-containing protein [Microthyrium microscopicum]|uniref:HET-domain-containing protein n=1 Tax=Microthyrium microscopicum TaxID=703497 RepID=A0A6A6UDD7_9PEZI|nr:HET-domain-containing protein [Microthyrium microscopicum]